jgi:hypothetical protein
MIVPIGALAEVGPAADLVRIAWSTCTTDSQTLTGTTDGLRRSRDGYASPIVVALAFADPHSLARELAATLMKIEQGPDSPMFRQNTAAFIYYLPDGALSNAEGQSNYVRVQVLTIAQYNLTDGKVPGPMGTATGAAKTAKAAKTPAARSPIGMRRSERLPFAAA